MTKERLRKALENILEAVRADYPAAVRLSEIDDIAEDALEESTPGPRAIACGQCGNLVNHCDRCKAELLAASWEYACKRMSAAEPKAEPIRELIEHIEKAGHVYSYEPIFERARDALNEPTAIQFAANDPPIPLDWGALAIYNKGPMYCGQCGQALGASNPQSGLRANEIDNASSPDPREPECQHEDHLARLLLNESCAQWCKTCGAFRESSEQPWALPLNRGAEHD